MALRLDIKGPSTKPDESFIKNVEFETDWRTQQQIETYRGFVGGKDVETDHGQAFTRKRPFY